MLTFYSYFDQEFDPSFVAMTYKLGKLSKNIYSTAKVCLDQYETQKETDWFAPFETQAVRVQRKEHSNYQKVSSLFNASIAGWTFFFD